MDSYAMFAPGGIIDSARAAGQSIGDAFTQYAKIQQVRNAADLSRAELEQRAQSAQDENARAAASLEAQRQRQAEAQRFSAEQQGRTQTFEQQQQQARLDAAAEEGEATRASREQTMADKLASLETQTQMKVEAATAKGAEAEKARAVKDAAMQKQRDIGNISKRGGDIEGIMEEGDKDKIAALKSYISANPGAVHPEDLAAHPELAMVHQEALARENAAYQTKNSKEYKDLAAAAQKADAEVKGASAALENTKNEWGLLHWGKSADVAENANALAAAATAQEKIKAKLADLDAGNLAASKLAYYARQQQQAPAAQAPAAQAPAAPPRVLSQVMKDYGVSADEARAKLSAAKIAYTDDVK